MNAQPRNSDTDENRQPETYLLTIDASVHGSTDPLPGDAQRCLQCHKCTAGCPLGAEMDLKPSQIVRLAQLNQSTRLLESKAIWLCTSCHTCSTRCPADVDLCRLQDHLRRRCIESGTRPADHRAVAASKAMLHSVADAGRMNELTLMRRFKLDTKTLFERFALGVALFLRGKLRLFKNKTRARSRIKKMIRRILPSLWQRPTE